MKILIMEDEESTRRAWTWDLTSNNHEVLSAADLETAFLIFHENIKDIDLVITDLDLTHCGGEGLKLIKEVRSSSPNTRIILASGGMTSDIAKEAISLGAESALAKLDLRKHLLKVGILKQ